MSEHRFNDQGVCEKCGQSQEAIEDSPTQECRPVKQIWATQSPKPPPAPDQ